MLPKIWEKKGVRFLAVGVINTSIDLTILNILIFVFHAPVLIANLVSASISISISYFLNHRIVFRSQERRSLNQFLRFFAVTGFGILAIQSAVIYLMLKLFEHYDSSIGSTLRGSHLTISSRAVEVNVAKLTAVVVTMIWNFCIYHFVIFKAGEASGDDGEAEIIIV